MTSSTAAFAGGTGRERRFRFYGLAAIVLSLLFLSFLFISIVGKGYTAFQQTFIELNIYFDPDVLRQDALATADYGKLVKASLRQMFPEVTGRRDKRDLYELVSSGAAFNCGIWSSRSGCHRSDPVGLGAGRR